MTTRERHRRRRPRTHYRPVGWIVAGLAVASLVGLLGAFQYARFQRHIPRIAESDGRPHVDARMYRASNDAASADRAGEGRRAIYRYSVVPGGVLDGRELRAAAQRDAVVAAHYSKVSFDAVRTRIVTERRMRYMSYRLGSNIYWTRQPVALSRGETILDDGTTQVRARCGNLISAEPRTPTYLNEPPPGVFDETDPHPPVNGSRLGPPHAGLAPPSTIPGTSPNIPGLAVPLIIGPPSTVPSVDAPSISGGFPLPLPLVSVGRPLRPAPPSPTAPSQPQWNPIIPRPESDGSPAGNKPDVPGSTNPHYPLVPGEDPKPPVDPVQVPEPGTWLLVGVGGAVAAARKWRAANR